MVDSKSFNEEGDNLLQFEEVPKNHTEASEASLAVPNTEPLSGEGHRPGAILYTRSFEEFEAQIPRNNPGLLSENPLEGMSAAEAPNDELIVGYCDDPMQ